jgi:uncharacterized protein YecT (DUF1311 family)
LGAAAIRAEAEISVAEATAAVAEAISSKAAVIPHPTRFLALLLLASVALAAPEAEKRPSLKQAQAEFEKADRDLNAAWADLKTRLGGAAELLAEQKAWVGYRDHIATSPMITGLSGDRWDEKAARKTPEYFECAAEMTRDRAAWLRGYGAELNDSDLSGHWSDSYGGDLQIVHKGGKLFFEIDVVRGPTAHVGSLAGVASWNYPLGWFSDKGRDKDKEDETNLAFVLENRKLRLFGANTQYYHGARAHFDGDYVRVKELSAAEKAELEIAAGEGKPVSER